MKVHEVYLKVFGDILNGVFGEGVFGEGGFGSVSESVPY